MPRSTCDFCCNPGELARSQDSFRDAVLNILCSILAASDANAGAGVVLEQAAVTPIPAAFTDTGLLDGTFQLKKIYVQNQTDANIEVSLDNGTTVAFTVFANSYLERDLGNFTAAAADDVQVRYQAATPWSIGTAYFDGSY